MADTRDLHIEALRSGCAQARKETVTKKFLEEFSSIDKSELSHFSDAELAAWQAQFSKETPQFILADQLWKYRLARRSAKFAVAIAMVSALVGAAAGYVFRGHNRSEVRCSENGPVPETMVSITGKGAQQKVK